MGPVDARRGRRYVVPEEVEDADELVDDMSEVAANSPTRCSTSSRNGSPAGPRRRRASARPSGRTESMSTKMQESASQAVGVETDLFFFDPEDLVLVDEEIVVSTTSA